VVGVSEGAGGVTGPLNHYARQLTLFLSNREEPLHLHVTEETAQEFIRAFALGLGRMDTYDFQLARGAGVASFMRPDVRGYVLGQMYPVS
jgi:hypothetical protein